MLLLLASDPVVEEPSLGERLHALYQRPKHEVPIATMEFVVACWIWERGRAGLELEATRARPRPASDVLIDVCGGTEIRIAWACGALDGYLEMMAARAVEQPQ